MEVFWRVVERAGGVLLSPDLERKSGIIYCLSASFLTSHLTLLPSVSLGRSYVQSSCLQEEM